MAGASQPNKSPVVTELHYPPDDTLKEDPLFHQNIKLPCSNQSKDHQSNSDCEPQERGERRRSARPRSASGRSGRSRSRGRNAAPKTPSNPCRSYEEIGFCIRGVHVTITTTGIGLLILRL